ncbi:aldehyde dehydrogenase [Desulfopila sp. IMCC35008]|uniref:aldehyde dehydrogenase family protein n=1 Tax=Desulfopila sp. IMCC35008 TaxID=2653858 RepID=UPI0013D6F23C|nr:aldehyde dehydrogenase [Desulfopila sp. IMCC35008]
MVSSLESRNPSNGEKLGEVVVTHSDTIANITKSSKKAQKKWAAEPLDERIRIIKTAWSAVETSIPGLAQLLSQEMGKDIRRSTGEVQGTIFGGPWIAESAGKALQPGRQGRTLLEYRPLGVVGVISPWNYPLAMANNLMVPALVAGNSVIWKPSEETPLIAQAFHDIISKQLPDNLLQIIHGDGEQGRQLVESDIQLVAFTGSLAVGKKIMERASTQLTRLVMELGGNDPMIVMADADLPAAARFAVASSFENSGQMCTATERIYVDSAVADRFEEMVVSLAGQYRVGTWDMEGVNYGPLINEKQHRRVVEHILDAVDKGAELLLGTTRQEPPYISPTVLGGMTPKMKIEQEETFGPLVCMSRFTEIEEAIVRANDSPYGLGAVVFGSQGADYVARRLEAGMIGINQGVGGEGDSPWVGAKQSGFGFHGSPEGHRQFAQVCVISNEQRI